jgi:hypothetical protein
VFFTAPGPGFGARATLAQRRVQLGLLALLGRQTVAAGDVNTGIVALAADIPFWHAAHSPDVSLAAGGELGVTWAKGKLRDQEQEEAHSRSAPFASALLRLNWGGRVAPAAFAEVAWALGYAKGLNALAAGHVAASTHGAFAAMTATIAWAP